jgi:hypothetical protein
MTYTPDIRTALERLLQLRQTDTHALLGSDWHNAFEAASRAFYAHILDVTKLPLQEREDLAYNPNTPPEILTLLARDENYYVRCVVAQNPNTPPEILTILARDEVWSVRWRVALNPNTPPESLTILARDEDYDVRWGVADNPNTPPEILTLLARDKNVSVRRCVAYNPNTPPEILTILAQDGDSYVRADAQQNPNYTPVKELKVTAKQYEALKKLLAASQDEDLKSILTNSN